MQPGPAANLDAEELLHLAVLDSREGHHDSAISKLKQALALKPANAGVQFMLAAEHAEIGLYERAVEGMSSALLLDPELHIARFQLGLLHFRQGRIDEAKRSWAPLDQLGPDNSLYLFKSAFLKILDQSLDEAMLLLEQSLAREKANPALAAEIAKVLANVREHAKNSATKAAADSASGHLLVHRYDDASRNDRG